MCSGQLIHHGQVLFIDTGLSYLKTLPLQARSQTLFGNIKIQGDYDQDFSDRR